MAIIDQIKTIQCVKVIATIKKASIDNNINILLSIDLIFVSVFQEYFLDFQFYSYWYYNIFVSYESDLWIEIE